MSHLIKMFQLDKKCTVFYDDSNLNKVIEVRSLPYFLNKKQDYIDTPFENRKFIYYT